MPHILAVDDDPDVLGTLERVLKRDKFDVTMVDGGKKALAELEKDIPDLMILDIIMPGMDGIQVCTAVRADPRFTTLPILFLTAKGTTDDIVEGLDAGADDYVVKPFSTRELISRVRAVLRRASAEPDATNGALHLQVGDLVLDLRSHRVLAGERPVPVGPTEFRLLKLFMTAPGRAWSRRQLLTEIWGSGHSVEERTVDVHIRRLRKALEPTRHERYVQTVRGHGYRFSDVI